MSKSPNILVPALGGTALILGLAYGFSSRHYGQETIESLEVQVAQSQRRAADSAERAQAADAQIEALLAEQEDLQIRAASGGGLTEPAPISEAAYGLGRDALPEEIAAWDVDVLPDGRGLPVGSGDAWTGEELFVENCAACHGDFAEGVGNWPVLAGGFDTLANEDPVKTVGSYWPYLSTVWDYTHRSMPFGNAGTLSADDTYAIVAYILYSNNLVDDDFELSNENFLDVQMPNADGFVVDDRAEMEYSVWRTEPCMQDCKDSVEITMRASVLDVTPDEEGMDAAADHAMDAAAPSDETTAVTEEVLTAAADPALIEAGQGVFRQCTSCHQVGEDARNGTGPHLNGLMGRQIGGVDGFRYSPAMADAGAAGDAWTAENLTAFLMDPRGAMQGTRMAFRGLRSEDEAAALFAYLESQDAQ